MHDKLIGTRRAMLKGSVALAGIAAAHYDHAIDAGVMDQFRAQDAGLAGHQEPRTGGGDTGRGGVADDVHLGVVAADLDAGAALHLLRVAQALVAAAATGSDVIRTCASPSRRHSKRSRRLRPPKTHCWLAAASTPPTLPKRCAWGS